MPRETWRNKSKGILVIAVIAMFTLAACGGSAMTDTGNTIPANAWYNTDAETLQPNDPPPTEVYQSNTTDGQLNATDEQTDNTDGYQYNPAYIEQGETADNPTNGTAYQPYPVDTHVAPVVTEPPTPAENTAASVELTPIQQMIFDMFVDIVSEPGQIVTVRMPGISHAQEAIGEAQAGNTQIFTQNPDGTRTANPGMATPTMRLIAFSHETALTEFSNGTRRVASGRLPQAAGEAIISREFADLNGLSVGGTVEFASMDLSVTHIMRLTIVGIYYDGTPEFPPLVAGFTRTFFNPVDNRRNEVITHIDTLFDYPAFVGLSYIDARPVS